MFDRRSLLAAALLPVGASRAVAAPADAPAAARPAAPLPDVLGAPAFSDERPLWPGTPPGGAGVRLGAPVLKPEAHAHPPAGWLSNIQTPALRLFRPARPTGAAALVIPGGGYGFLSLTKEGDEIARWLNGLGVTAFVLLHRLPAEGWADREAVPLQDAQRAMRLIVARAGELQIDPRRIGVIGFSAGGHLAGSLLTKWDAQVYAPLDAADRLSARPAWAGMIYPVVSLQGRFGHVGTRGNLLGAHPSREQERAWSVDVHVAPGQSPTFLVAAADDATVPVQNSVAMFSALKAADVPAELHVFQHGGHGFGLRLPAATPASAWPRLFEAWARADGLI